MTILSTDLRALKRRGYNGALANSPKSWRYADQVISTVDRILRQQKAEREAAENAVRATADNTALISRPSQKIQNISPPPIPQSARPVSSVVDGSSPALPGSLEPPLEPPSTSSQSDPVKPGSRPPSTMMQNWKRKLTGMADSHRSEHGDSGPPIPGNPGMLSNGPLQNNPTVTPKSNIGELYHSHLSNILSISVLLASNIDMAIKACRREQGHLLRNRDHMQMIKESLDEGYCDISGRAGDLDYIGGSRCKLLFGLS